MALARYTPLSLPLLAQYSLRESSRAHLQVDLQANRPVRATAVDGGFTVTVPTAPKGSAPISGQSYVVLTGCNTTVTDDTVAAGPAVLEVGPL